MKGSSYPSHGDALSSSVGLSILTCLIYVDLDIVFDPDNKILKSKLSIQHYTFILRRFNFWFLHVCDW
jgi:hypothetical protein